MSRYDRYARRLSVCRICKHDKWHLYEVEGRAPVLVCAGCGYELPQAQEAARV